MASQSDWRRMGQEKYLMGKEIQYVDRYIPFSEIWEHEHCEFCTIKISTYDGDLHSGYCSVDEEQPCWICETCFHDFKDEFKWKVRTE